MAPTICYVPLRIGRIHTPRSFDTAGRAVDLELPAVAKRRERKLRGQHAVEGSRCAKHDRADEVSGVGVARVGEDSHRRGVENELQDRRDRNGCSGDSDGNAGYDGTRR